MNTFEPGYKIVALEFGTIKTSEGTFTSLRAEWETPRGNKFTAMIFDDLTDSSLNDALANLQVQIKTEFDT